MLVPKLTFMYRSGLHRYFVCTESDCTDIDIQCTETCCTEKKHVSKVYVPKLSCTESDLPHSIYTRLMASKIQNTLSPPSICHFSQQSSGRWKKMRLITEVSASSFLHWLDTVDRVIRPVKTCATAPLPEQSEKENWGRTIWTRFTWKTADVAKVVVVVMVVVVMMVVVVFVQWNSNWR